MSDHSAIEWTDATWNPIRGMGTNRWMCQKISPGCDHCYASTMNHRWGGEEYKPGDRLDHVMDKVLKGIAGVPAFVRLDAKALIAPLGWKQPRRVFVCSMTDLFGEWVPVDWIEQMFGVMASAPQHQFQVLTKRPQRMREFVTDLYERLWDDPDKAPMGPLPNVWIGTSIELDRYAWRAEYVRQTPATVRFISAEPLLGPLPSLRLHGIDWLIAGGESGAGHRPMEADWARDLRDRCQAEGAKFFFKQWGGRTHAEGGRLLDGRIWDQYPEPDDHARKNAETVRRLQAAVRA